MNLTKQKHRKLSTKKKKKRGGKKKEKRHTVLPHVASKILSLLRCLCRLLSPFP
jgi:hypothetical protein